MICAGCFTSMTRKLIHPLIIATVSAALLISARAETLEDKDAPLPAETFVIVLSDELTGRADDCRAEGDRACADYFLARASYIQSGGEAYSLPVPATADMSAWENNGPPVEYAETYALITSEAADMEPRAVARVQTSYEGWVDAISRGNARQASQWHARWRRALDGITGPDTKSRPDEQLMSAIN